MSAESVLSRKKSLHPALRNAVIVAVCGAAALIALHFMRSAPAGAIGEDVGATASALRKAGDRLTAADSKGDAGAAEALLDDAINITQKVNDGASRPGMRNCQLAAGHLATGVMAVRIGGRWTDRDRFENALADCKR